ncbi:serine hydrolase [uncultured Pontibacter sp.]|uniref:serine hydrolase n=1 Tax=uncultured Pontibacter sp. TaxID=453356 RepID=UPI0026107B96|nr:serine hydrolase [uncultured Pontibacter sp.]
MDHLLASEDEAWPLEKTIAQVKQMKPKYPPGQQGKANYGNTNFKLLGRVLEVVMIQPLHDILTSVFRNSICHVSSRPSKPYLT